eukprot:GILK01003170.1.p1 GENE.GILK01003170.1~~GILK01003170.1.p1  ORF type:complete len:693 (-),score=174.76 GILK01003170.1:265-2274(-)
MAETVDTEIKMDTAEDSNMVDNHDNEGPTDVTTEEHVEEDVEPAVLETAEALVDQVEQDELKTDQEDVLLSNVAPDTSDEMSAQATEVETTEAELPEDTETPQASMSSTFIPTNVVHSHEETTTDEAHDREEESEAEAEEGEVEGEVAAPAAAEAMVESDTEKDTQAEHQDRFPVTNEALVAEQERMKRAKRTELFLLEKKQWFLSLLAWEDERKAQCQAQRHILDAVFHAIQNRFATAKEIHTLFIKYLKERAAVELSYSKALAEHRKFLPRQDKDKERERDKTGLITGTFRNGLTALGQMHDQVVQEHADFAAEILKEFVGNGIAAMAAEYIRHSDTFTEKTVTLLKDIDAANLKARKAFAAHESLFREMESAMGSQKIVKNDLWLSERKFSRAAQDVIKLQKVYAAHMMNLLSELTRLEEWRISNVSNIMTKFIQRMDLMYSHLTTIHIAEALKGLTRIDALGDAKGLSDVDNLLRRAPTGESDLPLPSTMLDTAVRFVVSEMPVTKLLVREGKLERLRGKLMKEWKVANFVITKDRFLHCFKMPGDIEPSWSLHLPDCTIAFEPASGDNAFSVAEEKKGGMFSMFSKKRRYVLRAPSQDLMVDWVVALKSSPAPDTSSALNQVDADATARPSLSPAVPEPVSTDGARVQRSESEQAEFRSVSLSN